MATQPTQERRCADPLCGCPVTSHGDRAVAACDGSTKVPLSPKDAWATRTSKLSRCSCRGWR